MTEIAMLRLLKSFSLSLWNIWQSGTIRVTWTWIWPYHRINTDGYPQYSHSLLVPTRLPFSPFSPFSPFCTFHFESGFGGWYLEFFGWWCRWGHRAVLYQTITHARWGKRLIHLMIGQRTNGGLLVRRFAPPHHPIPVSTKTRESSVSKETFCEKHGNITSNIATLSGVASLLSFSHILRVPAIYQSQTRWNGLNHRISLLAKSGWTPCYASCL